MEPITVRNGDGILLLRLGAVGDVVRTLPSLAALRKSHPEARLAWVVEAGPSQLLPGKPWLDEVFVFPRNILSPVPLLADPGRALHSLRALISQVRDFHAAFSLDFQGSAKSSLIGRASGTVCRIGFDRSGSREGSFLLNNTLVKPSSPRQNRIFKSLELLKPLGVVSRELKFPYPDLEPSAKISAFLEPLGAAMPIAVHPGTSLRQAHKRWPVERFVQLVRDLAGQGYLPILTWGPGEESVVQSILRQTGGAGLAAPATTLAEMRHLLSGCRLFIGGDTGPMHLAWTHGVPVVALFGSTDPGMNGPLGDRHRILAPAWERGRPQPRRGDPSPLLMITPTRVLQAARELLCPTSALTSQAPAR